MFLHYRVKSQLMREPQYEKRKKKMLSEDVLHSIFFWCWMGRWLQTRISRTALAHHENLNFSRDPWGSIVMKLQVVIRLNRSNDLNIHIKWSFELPYHLNDIGGKWNNLELKLVWNRYSLCAYPFTCIYVLHHSAEALITNYCTDTISWQSILLLSVA